MMITWCLWLLQPFWLAVRESGAVHCAYDS